MGSLDTFLTLALYVVLAFIVIVVVAEVMSR